MEQKGTVRIGFVRNGREVMDIAGAFLDCD